MKEKKLNSNLAKEVLTYVSFFDDELLNKIPDNFLKYLNKAAADSDKEFYIDKNKTLDEQDMSEDCKDLLGLLYFTYIEGKE